jgi:hypothetical protein
VTYYARAAMVAGTGFSLVVLALGAALAWVGAKASLWDIQADVIWAAAILAWFISAGWLTWTWTSSSLVHRPWAADDLRMAAIRESIRPAAPVVEDAAESDPAPDTAGLEAHLGVYLMLTWHYTERLACTRPECEARYMSQTVWNRANRALQVVGVKGSRKWLVEDLYAAFGAVASIRFDESGDRLSYRRSGDNSLVYVEVGDSAGDPGKDS